MNAPKQDPYAPPSSELIAAEEPRLALRYVRAERAVLLVLALLIAQSLGGLVFQLRGLVPVPVVAFAALYQLGLPAAALLLVLQAKHVGYLLSLTVGSMFVSLSLPIFLRFPPGGAIELALSIALWALSWYAARGRFGYLFKRPAHLGRPSALRRR